MSVRERLAHLLVRAFGAEQIASVIFPGMVGQTSPRIGTPAMLRAYSEMPWLRAIAQKISHDVATTQWVLTAPQRGGKYYRDRLVQRAHYDARRRRMKALAQAGNLRVIESHPALDFLDSGNQWFPGMVSMQVSQAHLDLVGELAWIVETNSFGMPLAHVPIPPTWISDLPRADWPFYRVVGPGVTRDVPAENMLFLYHPNPAQPFTRGTGIGQVLGDELETDEYAAKHTKEWFKNKAVPPYLIAGLGLALPEMQRLEERWLQKHQGRGKGWLPHFMSKDVKVHELSHTFKDQELISLRQHERDTIRQVFGFPPEILGIVENSNRATIEAAEFIYQRHVIVPRLEFLRAGLQERLVPRFDERLNLDYISPVIEDREYTLKVMQAAPWAFMADEWRDRAGTDELPKKDGKVFMMPFNLTPVQTLGGRTAPVDIFESEALNPPAPSMLPPAPGEPPALPPAPEEEEEEAPAKGAVRKDDLIKRVTDAVKSEAIAKRVKPVVTDLIRAFGQRAIDQSGVELEFNASDPAVIEHLRRYGANRVTLIDNTTRRELRETLTEGVANSEGTEDLVARIQSVFEEASRSRALLIARTEVGRSSNFATVDGFAQADVEEKEWLSTQDAEVRDTHVELDGTVVLLMEDFVSPSGARGQYPGDFGVPEEDCNCRCNVLPVMKGKRLKMTAEQRGAIWRAAEADRRPYDRQFMSALRAGFREQAKACIAALDANRSMRGAA